MNDPLDSIREKQWVVQTTNEAYLDQLVDRSAGPPPKAVFPVVCQPLVSQPIASSPPAAFPMVSQPGGPIPPLLSLRLQPDLNALARTLSPQALRYVHLGIQISRAGTY